MTTTNNSTSQTGQTSLAKRMLIGAGIGFFLISLFLLGGEGKPEWGRFWMIRPLVIVPLAGAFGGACTHIILRMSKSLGIHKIIALLVSLIVFVVGLWMGAVLGLDGTYWD